jgi:hypothetical protein
MASLIVLSFITCAAASLAHAGTYTTYQCQLPNGRPASVEGWRVVNYHSTARYDTSCNDGNGLRVEFPGGHPYPAGFVSLIGVQMPADLTIVKARAKQSLYVTSNSSTTWSLESGAWGQAPGRSPWLALNVCAGTVGMCTDPNTYEHAHAGDLRTAVQSSGGESPVRGTNPCRSASPTPGGSSYGLTLVDVGAGATPHPEFPCHRPWRRAAEGSPRSLGAPRTGTSFGNLVYQVRAPLRQTRAMPSEG